MSLILKLVQWRYEQLLKVFDFSNIFISDPERKIKVSILMNKLLTSKYISHSEKELYSGNIYYLIKRLMWLGIINYELDKNILHVTYLYNSYHAEIFLAPSEFSYDFRYVISLHNYGESTSDINAKKMQQLIITYYMLIDVIMNELIIDIRYEMKKQIYDIMLIKN